MTLASESPVQAAVTAVASYRRVAGSAILAVLAPVIVGLVLLTFGGRGLSAHGFGPFVAASLAYALFAALLVRLSGVRSTLLGILVALGPGYGAAVFARSPLGVLIAVGIGALGGFLGTRSARLLPLPRHGRVVIGSVAVAALTGQLFFVHNDPAQAALLSLGGDGKVLALYRFPGTGDAYALVDTPWGNVDGFEVAHVRLDSLNNWVLALDEPVSDRAFRGTRYSNERLTGMFGSSQDVPDLCAQPRVWWLIGEEHWGACWLPHRRIIVGVAPGGAETMELTMIDGSVIRRELDPVGGGYVLPSTTAAGTELPDPEKALRIAFFDQRGYMLDSRPSPRVAFEWYPMLARAAGAQPCRLRNASMHCPITAPEPEITYHATMSISILSPREFQLWCGVPAPPGAWTVVASMSPKVGADLDDVEGRIIKAPDTVRVVAGVTPKAGVPFAEWLDVKTARMSSSTLPCFPGTSSAHHIEYFLRLRTGTDGVSPVLSPSPRPDGWEP